MFEASGFGRDAKTRHKFRVKSDVSIPLFVFLLVPLFCSLAMDWKVSQEPQHMSSGKFWLKSDPDGAFRFLFLPSAFPEVSLFILP